MIERSLAWGIVLFLTFVVVIPVGLVYIVISFIVEEVWKWLRN